MALSKFTTNQYADKSVTGAKIADKTITGANLADNIVLPGSLKVNDGTTDLLSILTAGATLNTNLHVNGNITFTGSIDSTTVTVNTMEVNDAEIKLRAGQTAAPTTTDHAYLYVERGTLADTYIQWDENADKWKLSNDGTNAYRIVTDTYNGDITMHNGDTATYMVFRTTTANLTDVGGIKFSEDGTGHHARIYYDGSTIDTAPGAITFAGTSGEGTLAYITRLGLMYIKDDIKLGATGDINFNSKYYIGPNSQTAPTYAASKSLKFYTEGDYAFYSPTSTAATFSLYNETNGQRIYMQASGNDAKFTLSAAGSFMFYNNASTNLANIENDGDIWAAKDVSATVNLLAGGVVRTSGSAGINYMTGYLVVGGTAMSSTERLYVVGDAKVSATMIATTFTGDLSKATAISVNSTTGNIVDFKAATVTKASIDVNGYYTNASYSMYRIDDRDVKPTDTPKGHVKPYFTSLEGMTGAAGTDYQDLLVLNTYTDTSGGNVNALAFDKSEMKIRHYQAAQGATTWGTPKTLSYDDHTHDFVSSVGLKATKVTFAAGETTKTFTHNFGVAQYAVTVCSNSPMRHVYYSNKTNNAVDINIDDVPYGSAIDVDVIVFKY